MEEPSITDHLRGPTTSSRHAGVPVGPKYTWKVVYQKAVVRKNMKMDLEER